jgi:hypothetical protein
LASWPFQLDIDLTGQPAVFDTFLYFFLSFPFPSQECVKYFLQTKEEFVEWGFHKADCRSPACERRLSGGRRYPFDAHESRAELGCHKIRKRGKKGDQLKYWTSNSRSALRITSQVGRLITFNPDVYPSEKTLKSV